MKPQAYYQKGIYWLPVNGEEFGTLRYHLSQSALKNLENKESFLRASLLRASLIGTKKGDPDYKRDLNETRRQIRAVKKTVAKLELFAQGAHKRTGP